MKKIIFVITLLFASPVLACDVTYNSVAYTLDSNNCAVLTDGTYKICLNTSATYTNELHRAFDLFMNDGSTSPVASQWQFLDVTCLNTGSSATCTDFTYSDWSTCDNTGNQTRTILSSTPTDCIDGSPVLSQVCTPPALSCTSDPALCDRLDSIQNSLDVLILMIEKLPIMINYAIVGIWAFFTIAFLRFLYRFFY